MSTVTVAGANVPTPLMNFLLADNIEPGSEVGYATAKDIYIAHPLGKKLADTPVTLAMSQPRELAIPGAPEGVRERFIEQWKADGCDGHIANVGSLSRIYGVASIGILVEGWTPETPLDLTELAGKTVCFNVWDALNLAGSQVLNLDPNSMDFMKPVGVTAAGTRYHKSRAVVKIHEKPIYLSYTNSAFGFTGRSVYQRALYPLKSFVRTMITDEMVARKAGLLIAKMKPPGSIISNMMTSMFGLKRQLLKEGETDNVLGITPDESIETLNMQNVNDAMAVSRKNILDNIATAADMPAILLNQETFAEGFGEGTEDSKNVARYIGGVRDEFEHVFKWFDTIIMHRAWTPEFYATVQREYEDYADVPFETAFLQWKNAFTATWPNLIEEPDSEKVIVDDVKLKGIIATVQVFEPMLPDQENKAALLEWATDNLNENEAMFKTPLVLDTEAVASYEPPEPMMEEGAPQEPHAPKPFSSADADVSVRRLVDLMDRRRGRRANAAA